MIVDLLLFLLLGAVAGFLAGLLGIGGGLVIVPVLAWLLGPRAPDSAMHLAVATSLASIVFTSISSLWAHHRHGAVSWPTVGHLAPGLVAGAVTGALLASRLSGLVLTLLFGGFCLLAGARMLHATTPVSAQKRSGKGAEMAAGMGIGAISAMVGIGGGTLTVPWLLWRGRDIHRAVATSAACGLPIAVAAALVYVLSGWARSGLPAGSLGFVHLPALLSISLSSVLVAPLGARAAHRAPRRALQKVFGGFLVLLGIYLAGRGLIAN